MIFFEKIRWANLLSTGNQFTEISLNRSKSTLIVGENGSGKSTFIEAIMFALYGRAFRNINKPQLINSITGKGLLVEVEFSANNKKYVIRRGMKPNIFEIYQDGILLNQNADVREYQEMLEKSILKMNHRSFSQIVVLGSANYVPFMKLSPGERRQIIEDLLDIQIFSVMNNLLKEKINNNKTDILSNEHEISLIKQKLELKKKHVESLKANNKSFVTSKQELIDKLNCDIVNTQELIKSLSEQVEQNLTLVENKNAVLDKKKKLLGLEGDLENKKRFITKEIGFFSEHDNCPTCKQEIDLDFKNDRIEKRTQKKDEIETALAQIECKLADIDLKLEEITKINEEISVLNKEISSHNSDIRSWTTSIETLRQEIETIQNNTSQIDESITEVKGLIEEQKELTTKKKELFDKKDILDISSSLLKDTGIKTRIIKQYVPVINKLVNKYLAALDFFVNFELDEKFNETIKSRFRDDFSYSSFSEGEKFRIDIALLFCWRSVAKLRNSASTNLLIMDEVFDSSLDAGGIEEFLKILDSLTGDTNTFVISHKGAELFDKFHSVIRFEKHSNFSRIAS